MTATQESLQSAINDIQGEVETLNGELATLTEQRTVLDQQFQIAKRQQQERLNVLDTLRGSLQAVQRWETQPPPEENPA